MSGLGELLECKRAHDPVDSALVPGGRVVSDLDLDVHLLRPAAHLAGPIAAGGDRDFCRIFDQEGFPAGGGFDDHARLCAAAEKLDETSGGSWPFSGWFLRLRRSVAAL